MSSTMWSLTCAGFLLCRSTGEITSERTLALIRFGFPLVAIRHASEFDLVQFPSPMKYPAPLRFCFTHWKPIVLY